MEADFNRKADEPSEIVERLAPQERKDTWRSLDIFPGGVHGEMQRVTASCLTNVDGYYASLALKAMRLGVAMAYQSQIVNEFCQDVLFGIPRPHAARMDLGVLEPDYVNALVSGRAFFSSFRRREDVDPHSGRAGFHLPSMRRMGPGYFATTSSAVSKRSPSDLLGPQAWVKGGLWMAGQRE